MTSERNQGGCDVPPVEQVQIGPVTCFRQQPVYAPAGGDRVAGAHLQLSQHRLLERRPPPGGPPSPLRNSPPARAAAEIEPGPARPGLPPPEAGDARPRACPPGPGLLGVPRAA